MGTRKRSKRRTTTAGVSFETLEQTPERAFRFLLGLSRNPAAQGALTRHGFGETERRRGVELLGQVLIFEHVSEDDVEVNAAIGCAPPPECDGLKSAARGGRPAMGRRAAAWAPGRPSGARHDGDSRASAGRSTAPTARLCVHVPDEPRRDVRAGGLPCERRRPLGVGIRAPAARLQMAVGRTRPAPRRFAPPRRGEAGVCQDRASGPPPPWLRSRPAVQQRTFDDTRLATLVERVSLNESPALGRSTISLSDTSRAGETQTRRAATPRDECSDGPDGTRLARRRCVTAISAHGIDITHVLRHQ